MVTRADIADVYVFDGTEGILLPVAPDPNAWPRIRGAWDKFAEFIAAKKPPPLTDRDTRLRDDPEWLESAAAYLELRTAHDSLANRLDAAKELLIAQASHAKEQGGGVTVTRLFKRGNVDYKRIAALDGVDLEQYRGAGREETRITVA